MASSQGCPASCCILPCCVSSRRVVFAHTPYAPWTLACRVSHACFSMGRFLSRGSVLVLRFPRYSQLPYLTQDRLFRLSGSTELRSTRPAPHPSRLLLSAEPSPSPFTLAATVPDMVSVALPLPLTSTEHPTLSCLPQHQTCFLSGPLQIRLISPLPTSSLSIYCARASTRILQRSFSFSAHDI